LIFRRAPPGPGRRNSPRDHRRHQRRIRADAPLRLPAGPGPAQHAGAGELCTTAVTVAEIRYGLERLPDGRRKDSLLAIATEVFAAFSEFVQPFDADAAVWYATIVAHRDCLGLPIDGFDAQIAAICRTRGAALATRNAKDFRETGIDLIDPWQQA
jgi:predicted nucleic acid-binding protein